jgi:glucose-fructose oxidoreductase
VLRALVSDEPKKLEALGRRYGVTRLYSYEEYERCLAEVDAVFIALPNTLHREYTVRAARHGVHVLCEKPMAVSEADARAMMRACEQARVKLMIAYRLHFEPATLAALDAARKGRVGELRFFQSSFPMKAEPGNLRLKPGEGGALYDIGIYCLNAARNLFGAEPTSVYGEHLKGEGARFRRVPETTSVVMRFPRERVASFTCSFGAEGPSAYDVYGTKGILRMSPAFSHSDRLTLHVVRGEKTRKRTFPATDQFAAELLHFSRCILRGLQPGPSGEEGYADVRVLAAIERSAGRGRPVRLGPWTKRRRPTRKQEIRRPKGRTPSLVAADDPRPD